MKRNDDDNDLKEVEVAGKEIHFKAIHDFHSSLFIREVNVIEMTVTLA